jgi:hypothetical protein
MCSKESGRKIRASVAARATTDLQLAPVATKITALTLQTASMLSSLLKHCRNLWLVSLLALTVFGGQVLQASPLHNHAQETVDCALCHLQTLGDDSEYTHGLVQLLPAACATSAVLPPATPAAAFTSPYQGRAPPITSS